MKKIGGNITATVQQKTLSKNAIGESITTWTNLKTITGFLDYSTGETSTAIYNAKLADTTNIFFCDYVELPAENQIRFLINSKPYEVKLIDNPMGLNEHIEIYLRYVGT